MEKEQVIRPKQRKLTYYCKPQTVASTEASQSVREEEIEKGRSFLNDDTPQPLPTLELPQRELLKGTAEVDTSCRVRHSVATALTENPIKMGGGSIDDSSLSASSSYGQRKEKVSFKADNTKLTFKGNSPKFVITHWDTKVIKYEHRRETDDRLAVVASFPSSDLSHQFLAAPRIPDSTGMSQKEALCNVIKDWEIPEEAIIGMSWDTTTSNTGVHKGAATLFEKELGHAILWLACRHHIGELHIKHADVETRGAWHGPVDPLFKRFRQMWPDITVDLQDLRLWTWPDRRHQFLVDRALEVRVFCEHHLQNEAFERDDYRELCELIIKFLGGQVFRPNHQGNSFVLRAPGDLHHARFLVSALYIMKLALLADVVPQGLLTQQMLRGIDQMAQYIALFHGPWFLQARLASSSPRLDLQLWNHMCTYETIDAGVAGAVRNSIKRHLWYLTEELVILALFDSKLDDGTKAAMATNLRTSPRPMHFQPGKPNFPEHMFIFEQNLSLEELIGSKSWLIFHLLQIDDAWLDTPPNVWTNNQDYQTMSAIINDIVVVNDAAEREVNDIHDYANTAQDSEHRGQINLVSNSHRIYLPQFLKNEMQEKL